MRTPRAPGQPPVPAPPGGRALDRARQFREARGLPPPEPDTAVPAKVTEGSSKPAPPPPRPDKKAAVKKR